MTHLRLLAGWAVGLALATPALATDAAPGETRWVGDYAFQYLGPDDAGRDQWLYPHPDGALEVLTAEGPAWEGELGSRYLPTPGRFERRFQLAQALTALEGEGQALSRSDAARVLALFVALHDAEPDAPFEPPYLEPLARTLRRALDDEDEAWVTAQAQRHRDAVARVATPGTRVLTPQAPLRSAADHYQALIADGYLDVCVVGGNSENTETGELYSLEMAQRLLTGLRADGFTETARAEPNVIDCERGITLGEHAARVRVRIAAAHTDEAAVLAGLATFVEGLAHADVVLFFGHSNKGAGIYVSDRKRSLENFRLDADHRHLEAKCHGLGRRPHQVVWLQCCLSYARYGSHIAAYYDASARTAPGLVGPAERVPKGDFAPRCGRFLELLCQGAGPRRIARELDDLRPMKTSPAMLLRGVLQPRHSFVLPAEVTITAVAAGDEDDGFVAWGVGSDGVRYPSTAVFPQDAPGEVVQVVGHGEGVYGVTDDGRLLEVSADTGGACVEVVAPREGRRVVCAGWARRLGKRRLFLLDDEGRLRHLSRGGDRLIEPTHALPPAGVTLVGLANDADGRLVAVDAEGGAWASRSRRWEPTAPVALPELAPSLRRGGRVGFAP